MHILTQEPDITSTLRSFGRAILTDWYCWQDWYVLTIASNGYRRDMDSGRIATTLRAELNEYDGSVLWLDHGPSLAIFHAPKGMDFPAFEDSFIRHLAVSKIDITSTIYSMNDEPEEILVLLSRQLGIDLEVVIPEEPSADFAQSVHRYNDLVKLWPHIKYMRLDRAEPHILVVDDDALTRNIISHSLKHDYPMMTATDAAEAVRKHLLFAPNIIFLDINLPDHDGFTYLRHVRQHDPHCKIIMFSSGNYFTNRLKAFAHGASGFVGKPFRRVVFDHYIDAWHKPVLSEIYPEHAGAVL